MLLRHHKLHAKDGSIDFRQFAKRMHCQMQKETKDQRYREDNWAEWGWFTDADLLSDIQTAGD